jgi:hypothetical protein
MIKPQSDDPDVTQAAQEALDVINTTLSKLPPATEYDYGGHELKIGEYDVCTRCARAIAEAQAAERTIRLEIDLIDNETVREHLELAAHLFHLEAETAVLRAELHNGQGTEPILNSILGFLYERGITEQMDHNHQSGGAQ